MTFEIVSPFCGGKGFKAPGIGADVTYIQVDNRANIFTPCEIYQESLVKSKSDVIMHVHDDVTIHEQGWMAKVMQGFDNPEVVAVGLGGAIGLGNYDLYRKPYRIQNMARIGYCSNQTDAEVHGERYTGTKQVAVLDAFFLAVHTSFLRSVGGWPTHHLTHHCLDLWLACEAARQGLEIWMTGVDCTHHGGGTSTKTIYSDADWLKARGGLAEDHSAPHKWLYHTYRDVLPLLVPQVATTPSPIPLLESSTSSKKKQ